MLFVRTGTELPKLSTRSDYNNRKLAIRAHTERVIRSIDKTTTTEILWPKLNVVVFVIVRCQLTFIEYRQSM